MANIYKENPLIKVVMLKGQDGEEKLINQADGSGLSFWVGTQAEYDAIPEAELIENCVYYITDDTRDDFRTDLNALDTKVDNHYTELDERIDDNASAIADNTTDIEANATRITGIENAFFTTGEVSTGDTAVYCAGVAEYSDGMSKIRFTTPLPKILKDGQTFKIKTDYAPKFTIYFCDGTSQSFTDTVGEETSVTGFRNNWANIRTYPEFTASKAGPCTVLFTYQYEIGEEV